MINDQSREMIGMREQFADAPIAIGMPWRILTFSFILFALAIFIAVGLSFGYERYLDGKIANVDARIGSLAASVAERQQEFVTFYSQVVNLKTVLEKRSFTANAFTFLEKNVIGSVYFTKAEMNAERRAVSIEGFTRSISDLSQQIAVIEKDARNVDDVVLDEVALEGSGVGFSITILFNENFMKQPITL